MVSDQLLEAVGVLGEASLSEWPLYFVPLADDVLSLELDDAVSDLYLVCPALGFNCSDSAILMRTFSEKIRHRYIFPPKL